MQQLLRLREVCYLDEVEKLSNAIYLTLLSMYTVKIISAHTKAVEGVWFLLQFVCVCLFSAR